MSNDTDFKVSETLKHISVLAQKTGASPNELTLCYILEKLQEMQSEIKCIEKILMVIGC